MLYALGLVISGFVGTEIFSIFLHRYIFHGLLWGVHKSHHEPRQGVFEDNDLFSLFFASVSIALIALGFFEPAYRPALFVGMGISVYGAIYFVVHDLMAHKRYFPMKASNPVLAGLVKAHRRHHQRVDQEGQGPWGLFLYRYDLHHGRSKHRASQPRR